MSVDNLAYIIYKTKKYEKFKNGAIYADFNFFIERKDTYFKEFYDEALIFLRTTKIEQLKKIINEKKY